jgi:hypothetical protein
LFSTCTVFFHIPLPHFASFGTSGIRQTYCTFRYYYTVWCHI